jgi:hypothetical protein
MAFMFLVFVDTVDTHHALILFTEKVDELTMN